VNEYLVIRLGVEATDPVSWLVWSQQEHEIIASGVLAGATELHQLQERVGGRPVIGLVPASVLLFREVTLPGRLTRQSIKALPFLLEEEVASDVEALHLVVLASREQQVSLVGVDRALMDSWLGWAAEAGFEFKQLIPDVLTLPLQPGDWTAVEIEGQWLVRQNEHSGFQAEAEWLPVLFQTFEPAPVIASYSIPPADCAGEWQMQPAELPMQLMAQGALNNKVNLLIGEYRRQPEWQRLLLPWRKVAIAAGVLLVMLLGNQLLTLHRMSQESAQLKAQTVELYKQIFPGETRVRNPKQQMNQHLKALSGHSTRASFLREFMKLVPIFGQIPTLHPDQLRFDDDRGEFRLQATADGGYQDFDRFRQLAGEIFEVKPGDMKNENGKVQGTLTLRSKS